MSAASEEAAALISQLLAGGHSRRSIAGALGVNDRLIGRAHTEANRGGNLAPSLRALVGLGPAEPIVKGGRAIGARVPALPAEAMPERRAQTVRQPVIQRDGGATTANVGGSARATLAVIIRNGIAAGLHFSFVVTFRSGEKYSGGEMAPCTVPLFDKGGASSRYVSNKLGEASGNVYAMLRGMAENKPGVSWVRGEPIRVEVSSY